MFLRKILGRFLTTAPEKQVLNSHQLLQVSIKPGQQLKLQFQYSSTLNRWYYLHVMNFTSIPASATKAIPSTISPANQDLFKFLFSIPKSPNTKFISKIYTYSNTIITSTNNSFILNASFPRQYSTLNKFLFDIAFPITETINTTTYSA